LLSLDVTKVLATRPGPTSTCTELNATSLIGSEIILDSEFELLEFISLAEFEELKDEISSEGVKLVSTLPDGRAEYIKVSLKKFRDVFLPELILISLVTEE
jgi:hypothetical protein